MARILVIDDDHMVLSLIKKVLERENYEVVTASDGKEGLNIYEEQKQDIDLVITDLIMPETEGIGVILSLRKQDPDLKIIAMSGGGKVFPGDYLKIAKGCGATLTHKKPVKIQELVQSVQELLEQ